MNDFSKMIIRVIIATIMGNVMALIADGTEAQAMIMSLLFIIWFEVRDK